MNALCWDSLFSYVRCVCIISSADLMFLRYYFEFNLCCFALVLLVGELLGLGLLWVFSVSMVGVYLRVLFVLC